MLLEVMYPVRDLPNGTWSLRILTFPFSTMVVEAFWADEGFTESLSSMSESSAHSHLIFALMPRPLG
jgi:hypothetical protein